MVLLDTRMHHGKISYDEKDVQSWDQKMAPIRKNCAGLGTRLEVNTCCQTVVYH